MPGFVIRYRGDGCDPYFLSSEYLSAEDAFADFPRVARALECSEDVLSVHAVRPSVSRPEPREYVVFLPRTEEVLVEGNNYAKPLLTKEEAEERASIRVGAEIRRVVVSE